MNAEQHVPQFRFKDFSDSWEQRSFKTLYKKVIEKNDLSFESDRIISVANMYYKPNDSKSDEKYMETYNIFRLGDIAFEGHKSKNFAYGRFVENTIGDGIVSHVFDVFRPISEYDLNYWKYFIHYEDIMGQKLRMSTTKATMMNNLVSKDFLKQSVLVPNLDEQQKIGTFFKQLDHLITLHQRKLAKLKELKKGYLQKLFPQNSEKVPEFRFKGYSDAWEKRKLREITEINPKGKIPEVFRYVDLESVKNSSIISSKIETKQTAPSRAQRTAEIGDVFYQTVRPYQKNNVIFLLHSSMPYVFSTGYAQLRSNMNSFFILYLVQTDGFVNDVLNRATGTSYPAINPTHLATINVCFPKIVSEQNRIGQVLEHLDNLITATHCKLDLLKKLKKGYLQKMFC